LDPGDTLDTREVLIRESNLLRALIDNTPDLIYVKDRQSHFVLNNRAHLEWLGVSSQAELKGKGDFDLFPPEMAQRYYDDELLLMQTGIPLINREEPCPDAQGVVHWVASTKTPLRNRSGRIVGIVGITRDISARKRFEDALVFERQLLHTLMDNVPDSIYFKDSSSRFIRVNRAWASRRALNSPDEVIGKTDYDFFPRHLAASYYSDEQRIIHSQQPLVGKIDKIDYPDKASRWISITKVPVRDDNGKVVGTCGISRDITEMVQTEELLAHERDLLHMLMEYSTDNIYFKDLKSCFTRVNRAHARELGFDDPSQLIGKSDAQVHSPAHAADALRDEQAIIATGTPIIGKVEKQTVLNGTADCWVITSKWPLYDVNNTIVGTFGISRDITTIKQYEDALQRANAELELRVRERTADLTRRLAQLDYITTTTHQLAQFTELTELKPAILNAFAERFCQATASLCLLSDQGYRCVAALGTLDSDEGRSSSEKALEPFTKNHMQRPFRIHTWRQDDHVNAFPWPPLDDNLSDYIAIPLMADNRTIGIVQLFTSSCEDTQYLQEEKVLATVAAQAAISLSNATHYQELREQARLQGELDAAHSIQQSFTPRYKPSIKHVDLAGLYEPAYEVGGDYLDYFQTEHGDWVVVVADVCGKGIPASLLMAVLRTTFRIEARLATSAKQLLCAVNSSMLANLDDQSFITASCVMINPEGSAMTYARAGHPPLVKLNQGDNRVELVPSEGVALGLVNDAAMFAKLMGERTLQLLPGDRYLLYTDGLTEAWDAQKNCYGVERLTQALGAIVPREPEAIIQALLSNVHAFTDNVPLHDDLTILALTITD
jgi:PAS domain S-box-containing protein